MGSADRRHLFRFMAAATLLGGVWSCSEAPPRTGALTPSAATATSGSTENDREDAEALVPAEPAAIAVPAGHRFAFATSAKGVQIYACKVDAAGVAAWSLQGPDAELVQDGRKVGMHFAGPTWRASDGSEVVAKKVGEATVDAGSVPWLLLAVSSHSGATGRMTPITQVQRVLTSGGVAPATGCDAANAAATVRVPYTARYRFFE